MVSLSRNFGKEAALTAGLDHARADAVVVTDADLRDPPELMPELVRQWSAGFDVVHARRSAREGETWLKKATAHAFYRLTGGIGRVEIPANTGGLPPSQPPCRRRAGRAARAASVHEGPAWIGFPQKAVPNRRDPRFAGVTKWNYWRLWNFAIEGFTSFTIAPLRAATYFGLVVALLAFAFAGFITVRTIFFGDPVPGYPSLAVIVLFPGGLQLISIGILGEYVGRTFNESKHGPLYLLNEYLPPRASGPGSESAG